MKLIGVRVVFAVKFASLNEKNGMGVFSGVVFGHFVLIIRVTRVKFLMVVIHCRVVLPKSVCHDCVRRTKDLLIEAGRW